jgi:hypothetical protein
MLDRWNAFDPIMRWAWIASGIVLIVILIAFALGPTPVGPMTMS